MPNYDNGTFCGDKKVGRLLVLFVLAAAFLADPFGKHKVK